MVFQRTHAHYYAISFPSSPRSVCLAYKTARPPGHQHTGPDTLDPAWDSIANTCLAYFGKPARFYYWYMNVLLWQQISTVQSGDQGCLKFQDKGLVTSHSHFISRFMEESVTRLRYRSPNYPSGVSNCPGMKFSPESEFAAQREVNFKALRGTELHSAAGDISLCSIHQHPSVIQEPSGSGGT